MPHAVVICSTGTARMPQLQNLIDLEQAVIESVKRTATAYEIIEIDPQFSDTAAFCEKYGYSPQETCNTILVTSKKEPVKSAACVVLAHTRLDVNRRVKKLLGVQKLSFASADEVISLTGMEIGGVTPFSLPEGLPMYVDQQVMIPDRVIVGGGSRRLKIRISPDALTLIGGEVTAELALSL
jgi:prolyl-tRNA editing enzyme YbaK/EbsC (Cys-tRNA(Pro) deacylase)